MIKGIAFDKDGTLIDYEKYWVPITRSATELFLRRYGAASAYVSIMKELGITEEGRVDISGVLCHGTYRDVAGCYARALSSLNITPPEDEIYNATLQAFSVSHSLGISELICPDTVGIIKTLKESGITVALITTDDREGARRTLTHHGLYGIFDTILTNDGAHPTKPHPYYLQRFMSEAGLSPSEVVMVGDTFSDMEFARRAGVYSIAVSKRAENREKLAPYATATVPDISYISSVLPKINSR